MSQHFCKDFYYRDDDLYAENKTGNLASVKVSYDGKEYAMTYNSDTQRWEKNGIDLADVTTVAGNANYETLSKLAMEYSDGVIQASEKVNSNLLEDIKKSQKLFLPYVSEENYVTSYNEFYDKVLEK